MLNKLESLLNQVQEECAEASQRASKCIRFGIHEAREGKPTNLRLLAEEVADLLAVLELLDSEINGEFSSMFTDEQFMEWKQAKQEKVQMYYEKSQMLGCAE